MLKTLFKAFSGLDQSQSSDTLQSDFSDPSIASVTLEAKERKARADAETTAAEANAETKGEAHEGGGRRAAKEEQEQEEEDEHVDIEATPAKISMTKKKAQTPSPTQKRSEEQPPVIELLRKVSEPALLEPEEVVKLSQGSLRAQAQAQATQIFLGDDTKPLRFLVPPDLEHADVIKSLIVKHGGQLVTESSGEVIHLADRTSRPDQICYSPDLIYNSVVEDKLAFVGSFVLPVNLKKRSRPSFTEEDEELVDTALSHLDDGHYEPGENLFRLLVEEGRFLQTSEELKKRYLELMEEPHFKKRRFDFTVARDKARSPRKSMTPPKKVVQDAAPEKDEPARKLKDLGPDDQEAYNQIDQQSVADSEAESQRDDRSELGETEEEREESVRSEHAHQPQYDDYSIDGSTKSSTKGDSDNEDLDDFSLEEVEKAVQKLVQVSKKPRQTVLHAIYVCNGEIKVARDYLVKGPKAVTGKTWTKDEDRMLQAGDSGQVKTLEKQRGKVAVEARIIFLGECA